MNLPELKITFYDPDYMPVSGLTYSLIAARYYGKWIFVRHRGREGWEMPAGHIEKDETPDKAAVRELAEETGAEVFEIVCLATYSVESNGNMQYGRLFFAEVEKIGALSDVEEVEEINFFHDLPGRLTYPEIQPVLFGKVLRYIHKLSS